MTRQPPTYAHAGYEPAEAEASDAELIAAVRGGDESAFATLWSRHEAAAHRLARQISNPSNADDLVSEAFMRVLRALQAGSGPDGAFRPYLFSTLRRINIDNGRSYYTRVALTDDERDLDFDHADSAADVLADNAEGSAAWRAWNSLPDATKTLLWHLIIEEETPAQIAPLIGTTPNGVSSRAVRAKERLRQAFLQQHLLDADTDGCRQARRRLGEYVRDALSTRDRTEVQAHLDTCDGCQRALFEVTDINQTMKALIAPMVLGGIAIAGNYAAAGSALHGGIFGQLHRVTHALKNPAIAAATVVTVVAAGIASAFAINAVNGGNAHPTTVAGPVIPGGGGVGGAAGGAAGSKGANGGVPIPGTTPTSSTPTSDPGSSATPTPTPTPSKSTTSTKKTTPAVKSTTGNVAVVPGNPASPSSSAGSSSSGTSSSTPPPSGFSCFGFCVPVSMTSDASLQADTKIVFQISGDWMIDHINPPADMDCDYDGTPGGTQVTCIAKADIPAGAQQEYQVIVIATALNPDPSFLTWVYTEDDPIAGAPTTTNLPTQSAPVPAGPTN
jgi:RNA polymerase sigma factor (sigma-70 family)